MRKPGLFLLLLFILTNASAQKATDYRKQQNYKAVSYTHLTLPTT